jgi:Carboxypeptidase regulatory-like domain/TonB dependent receptor
MSFSRRLLLCALLASAIVPSSGFAQLLQGTIDGIVTDPTKAAVAGATVTVTNQATALSRETQTNSQGEYTLPTLPPGTYTLNVKAGGFAPYSQTAVGVTVNEVTRVNISLTVGQVTQDITVSSQAANLQTDKADVHTDITSRSLTDLPTPLGRNYQLLLPVMVPGVATPTSGGSFAANPSRAVSIGFNGTSGWGNNTRIDGTSATDFNGTYPMYTPALEAIETVNVVTNSFDAEQGMASAVAINIQTKSGTNDIHGSAFEYHSDQHLKAYAWAADRTKPAPVYINNQFGATVGGPIKKNKLFYFVSYEGTYIRQSTALYSEVPTAAMKTGNLTASPTPIYDPMTGNANGTGRTAFPGNIIPPSRIDSGIQALLNLNEWPNPNVLGTGAYGLARNYYSQGTSGQNRNQWDTKLSWNPTEKLSFFTRFGLNDNSWTNPQQYGPLGGLGYSPSNSSVGVGGGKIYSGTISATYTFTPNLVADAYFGYSRNDAVTTPPLLSQNLSYTLLGIPGTQSSQLQGGGLPALMIDGFGGAGAGQIPESTLGPYNNFQPQNLQNHETEYVANVTWIKGPHNIRAGFETNLQRDEEFQIQATFCGYCLGAGGFQFEQGTTQLNGGPAGNDYNAFASFLLGLPSNAGKVTLFPPQYQFFQDIYAFYVRDQWQVNRKLTVTYGTRWEAFPFANRGSRGLEYFQPATNTMVICGVAGNPENCGITKDSHRFAPRAGIAYRLTDSTVVRAGYGLSNDPTNYGSDLGNRQNYPDIVATALTAPNSYSYATTLRLGLPAVIPPNVASGTVPVPVTAGIFTVDNSNYVRGYVQSWNFTVEQRIHSWIASAGYVATRSIDPVTTLNANWGPIGAGTAGEILNVLYGRPATTNAIGTEGTSKYDSLQARAEHRFAHGYQIAATYTYAKGNGYSSQIAIPYDFRLNYGALAGLAHHAVGLTMILDSPFGKGQKYLQNGFAGMLLGNWQVNAVSILRSGTPFTVTASNTSLNAAGSTQFGNCNSTPQQLGNIYEWYNTSAFSAPSAGHFGTCGTNSLWGPGLINLDLSLNRTFVLTERINLKFTAEGFNMANNPHHANPTSSVSSGTFMQALGIANTGREGIDERTFRIGLRLGW